jgi:hypothetical protein
VKVAVMIKSNGIRVKYGFVAELSGCLFCSKHCLTVGPTPNYIPSINQSDSSLVEYCTCKLTLVVGIQSFSSFYFIKIGKRTLLDFHYRVSNPTELL